jgi:hypothetical protein
MSAASAFSKLPVAGRQAPLQIAAKLRELGDFETAQMIEAAERSATDPALSFGALEGLFKPKPWQHTAHAYGYLAVAPPGAQRLAIQHAGNIEPDASLKNARLKITLNRLRVASYPGGGQHRILFDFYAQNQLPTVTEDLHFNSTVRAREGEQAAVIGYPIFVGLNVGREGVSFRCYTVNVKNDDDEAFLDFLESDIAKAGLRLATIAQPSLGPFVKLAMGVTKSIAQRHRNVPVQDFYVGLDFAGTTMGARLAQGDYIVVQIPERLQPVWDWSEWVYDQSNGRIVNSANPGQLIPYNFIVFGVSRYVDP